MSSFFCLSYNSGKSIVVGRKHLSGLNFFRRGLKYLKLFFIKSITFFISKHFVGVELTPAPTQYQHPLRNVKKHKEIISIITEIIHHIYESNVFMDSQYCLMYSGGGLTWVAVGTTLLCIHTICT